MLVRSGLVLNLINLHLSAAPSLHSVLIDEHVVSWVRSGLILNLYLHLSAARSISVKVG